MGKKRFWTQIVIFVVGRRELWTTASFFFKWNHAVGFDFVMFKYINQTCILISFRFWIATVGLQRILVDIYGMIIIRTAKLRLPKVEFRFGFFCLAFFLLLPLTSTITSRMLFAITTFDILCWKLRSRKTFQHSLETGHFSTRVHACTHCQRLMYIHMLILLVYLTTSWMENVHFMCLLGS